MTWNTPKTWSTGEMLTAQLMNEQVRDNLTNVDNRLQGAPRILATAAGSASPSVLTSSSQFITIDGNASFTLTPTTNKLLIQFTCSLVEGGGNNGLSVGYDIDPDVTPDPVSFMSSSVDGNPFGMTFIDVTPDVEIELKITALGSGTTIGNIRLLIMEFDG